MAASTKIWLNGNPPQVDDVDLNGFEKENNNLIESAGIVLNTGDNDQTSKAVAVYATGASYYQDSGVANAYVLSIPDSKIGPPAYFTGMTVMFIPANSNTGPSSINVSGLGVKTIVETDGAALQSDDIIAGTMLQLTYDGTKFRVTFSQNSSGSKIIINPTPITSNTTISASNVNRVYEVDCTSGSINITLPLFANVASGSYIEFNKIDSSNNLLHIFGNSGELISSYNDHRVYGKGSTFQVVAYNTQWKVNNYYDSIIKFWEAYFDSGEVQTISGGTLTTVVFPTTVINVASSYNSSNGIATMKVRGDWEIISSICSGTSGNTGGAYARATNYINNANIPGNSASLFTDSSNDFLGMNIITNYFTTLNNTDNVRCKAARIRITQTINGDEDGIPAFVGKLIKRAI